jgi:hypothetical protein
MAAFPQQGEPEEEESHGSFSGIQSRTAAFGEGHQGAGAVLPSAGLEEAQQRGEQATQRTWAAQGVGQQVMRSGNGIAADNQDRMLLGGGMLPSLDGVSADSWAARRPFMSSTLGGVA